MILHVCECVCVKESLGNNDGMTIIIIMAF